MYDQNAVKIYTDGSAMPNPGAGGAAFIVECPDSLQAPEYEFNEGYKLSTNQRMELTAVIRAMEWLRDRHRTQRFARAIVITDSAYVRDSYESAADWKDRSWKRRNGKPYENVDLWDQFVKARAKLSFHYEIKWEKGKTRDILNRVDSLAKKAAKNPTRTDFGYRPGKFTSTRVKGGQVASLYPANNDEILIRVFFKRLYDPKAGALYKISFDLYEPAVGYKRKHVAYVEQAILIPQRNHCYKVRMNADASFPRIVEAEEVAYLR